MTRQRAILVATILGSSIVFLDSTIVNVALDTIGRSLPTTFVGRLEGLTYVTSAYFAVLSALLILAGALNDHYGRARMFRVGLVGFGAASVACGLAPTMEVLIVARIAQAAFGALLVPGSLSILTATFEGEERGRAIGLWTAGTSATLIVGPLVGGLLVQLVDWRAAFLINVPLVALALWAATAIDESRDEGAPARFDWLGAAVVAVGVGGLAFGATRGQDRQWQDALAWAALAVGAVAVALVPFLMLRRRDPLVPPRLFASRNFTVVNLATLVIYGALYVSFAAEAVFFQGTLGYSPVAAGAAGMPVAILLTVLSTPVGRFAARIGPRPFMTIGPLVMAAGLVWLALVPVGSRPWPADPGDPATLLPPIDAILHVLAPLTVFGIGISLLVAPLTTALMASVPVRNAGLGSAINNAISRVGQPLVWAALFIAMTASFYPALAELVPGLDPGDPALRELVQPLASTAGDLDPTLAAAVREASVGSFRLAMLVSAGLLAIGAAISAIGLRPVRAEPGRDAPPSAAASG
jgi:EmrB/QacA subfamily drug resistance transporter